MNLRPATVDDAEILLAWRNDPVTRAASRVTRSIPPANHLVWLKKSVEDPDRLLLVAESDAGPVGTVRFDRVEGGAWEMSWTVAPEARGRGLGRAMVTEAIAYSPCPTLVCEIREGNTASEKIAQAAGFKPSRSSGGFNHFAR